MFGRFIGFGGRVWTQHVWAEDKTIVPRVQFTVPCSFQQARIRTFGKDFMLRTIPLLEQQAPDTRPKKPPTHALNPEPQTGALLGLCPNMWLGALEGLGSNSSTRKSPKP